MRGAEAVIIGGGLAGSSCAIELKRRGMDAVVFERERFPRRKVCGAFLSPGATRCLESLGVLDHLHAQGAVPVTRVVIRSKAGEMEIPLEWPGLGFSRERLDWILAVSAGVETGHSVESVFTERGRFHVRVAGPHGRTAEIRCRIVIDAAGRLSRFTRRRLHAQYGVAFQTEVTQDTSCLQFEFFDGGYGGSVAIEGRRTNTCFLVDRGTVKEYLDRPGCMVTGPVGYVRLPGRFLAIGDAAGMIDPFSGEGMRMAMESGRLAARLVGAGLARGLDYDTIRSSYEREWRALWGAKKQLASLLRGLLGHRLTKGASLKLGVRHPGAARRLLACLWD